MVKFMIQKENRMGLVQVITGLILLIIAFIWYIALLFDILILFLGALGLLFIIIGIHSLLPTPPMKGLLLLIIGSILTGIGLYFTRYLLLNPKILKSKSSSIYWTRIMTIIGILIMIYGIIQIRRKVSTRVNKTLCGKDEEV